jgi:WD40 repeat protein
VTTTSKSQLCSKTYSSPEHIHAKYSVVSDFMPGYNGNVVTGSENGSVIIYDLQRRNVRHVLKAHKDAVLAVSAHDRLPLISSGGMMADRKVEFWSLADMNADNFQTEDGTAETIKKPRGSLDQ